MLPVVIFFVLGLSMAWLIYQAWQEQGYLEALVNQLNREKELVGQKRAFVVLASHYLRTPLAIITNSIDLSASTGANSHLVAELRQIGQGLSNGVNSLIAAAQSDERSASQNPPRPKAIKSSLNYLALSVVGAFAAISLGVYLLVYLKPEDVKLSTKLIELALALFVVVLLYSARRVHKNRKSVKDYFSSLIVQIRILDSQRTNLIDNSLKQLKTPVSELKARVPSLKDERLIREISSGIAKFDSVIQRFIIFDGLRSGSMGTTRRQFSLGNLVDQVLQRHGQQMSAKKIDIKTKMRVKVLNQDLLLLEYALDSVVDNAISYSPEGSKIRIISKKKDGLANVIVEDNGPGISEAKLALLFHPFSRVEDVSENFEREGIGLNLQLSNMILQYLGGSISIDSKNGHGTKVKFSLPYK